MEFSVSVFEKNLAYYMAPRVCHFLPKGTGAELREPARVRGPRQEALQGGQAVRGMRGADAQVGAEDLFGDVKLAALPRRRRVEENCRGLPGM